MIKRFSMKKLSESNVIAFEGEAGYQAELLMPGWRWAFWILYNVEKHPWVQVPAGEIGVVIAQVGQPLPIGAKSGVYKKEFGNFGNLADFIKSGGGRRACSVRCCPPARSPRCTRSASWSSLSRRSTDCRSRRSCASFGPRRACSSPSPFGLQPKQLELVRIEPAPRERGRRGDGYGRHRDHIRRRPAAGRRHRQPDGAASTTWRKWSPRKKKTRPSSRRSLAARAALHNNYQDFQAFLDKGGRIGLQHDPLLYGAYTLNPFLISVEVAPMLVVRQGEVAIIKAYVGLVTQDTSGERLQIRLARAGPATAESGRSRCARASIRSTRAATRPRSCPPPS